MLVNRIERLVDKLSAAVLRQSIPAVKICAFLELEKIL